MVSIITPAYNAGLYIAETIESVQNQTYKNWELIIVDDGSTDNTKQIIESYLSDIRIIYIYQKNGRQGKARNKGIHAARGKYLAFLDADDLWTSNKLELQLNIMSTQQIDVLFSGGWIMTATNSKYSELSPVEGYYSASNFLEALLTKNQIPVLSVLVKKESVMNVGGFTEDPLVQNAEDYQLWLKLADAGCEFYGMKEKLFYYRVHQSQSTASDSLATRQLIWAIEKTPLRSVSDKEKKKAMLCILNKYLLYNVDRMPLKKVAELVDLYREPLKMYPAFILRYCMLILGKDIFKKVGYKYFKLNNSSPTGVHKKNDN